MAENPAPTDDTGTPPEPSGSEVSTPRELPPDTEQQPADSGASGPVPAVPAPLPLWRRGRVLLSAGIAAVLAVVLGLVLTTSSGNSTPRGTITLPGTLLGRSEDTSPPARAADRNFLRGVAAAEHGRKRGLAVAVYGHRHHPEFVVAGGRACSTCAFTSFRDGIRDLNLSGLPTRTFAPGPKGGSLLCHQAAGAAFACWWLDNDSVGLVLYFRGTLSSLSGAAATTRQIRAIVET